MIKASGSLTFGIEVSTVAEVREFLVAVEQYNLPDDTAVMPSFLACVLSGDVEPTDGGVIVKGLKADDPQPISSPFTSCENGHSLTAPNAHIYRQGGGRECRQCVLDNQKTASKKTGWKT